MKSRLTLAGGVVALIAALIIPAADAAAPAVQLSAKLKGASVPEGGDANGKGEIFLAAKTRKRKACFELTFREIESPEKGQIRKGDRGETGPPAVRLFRDRSGLPGHRLEGCVKAKRQTLRKITRKPEGYYVNVANDDWPDGAIRGQLKPAL